MPPKDCDSIEEASSAEIKELVAELNQLNVKIGNILDFKE